MGKRGPAKTPTSVLERCGSNRVYDRTNEPQSPKGLPETPEWLSSDERKVWDQVTIHLEAIGTLHQTDGNAIGRYCSLMVQWVKAKTYIEKHGDTYTVSGPDGEPRKVAAFPQAIAYKHLLASILRLEQEFGLTPSSRAGLSVETGKESASMEELFFGTN